MFIESFMTLFLSRHAPGWFVWLLIGGLLTGLSSTQLFAGDDDSMLAAVESDTAEAVATVELSGSSADACVILLHGLARTAASMDSLAGTLAKAGYRVANVAYPSRHYRIRTLSDLAVSIGVAACEAAGSSQLFMVTHSLGGILVRDYLSRHTLPSLQRVVMLAPPNHGSAVVDKLENLPGFRWLNGPAVEQLGTDERSVPLQLGAATVDTAIIAGSRSVNLLLSNFLENPDDGKVSVASARLDGMCAMLVLKVSHPFIMRDKQTMGQVLDYLSQGQFTAAQAEYPDCPFRDMNPSSTH